MASHTSFKNVSSFNESLISDQIESNVISFINWGLLGIGAFVNVTIPVSGAYGGQPYKLRLADNPNYNKGQVWEGFRKDWIWESGVECGVQPIQISGVFVNGSFKPTSGVGPYSHKIDYPNGRVVFNSAIASNSTVTCEHSFRYYNVENADAPWWKQIQTDSFRMDANNYLLYGSGQWSQPPEQRIQLPAIIVQATPTYSYRKGYEVGGLKQVIGQHINIHLLTETNYDMKFISNVIQEQTEKVIIGYDKNLMVTGSGFPLNYDGSKSANCKCYPDLINLYTWKNIRFAEMRGSPNADSLGESNFTTNLPFFSTTIKGVMEVIN